MVDPEETPIGKKDYESVTLTYVLEWKTEGLLTYY